MESLKSVNPVTVEHDELRRNYDTQSAISSLLQISQTDITLDEILKQALDIILSIPWLSVESRGAIFIADNEKNELVMKIQRGLAEQLLKKCAAVPFGVCMCGRAATTGKTQFAEKIDDRHDILYEGILPHGHYCVPIVSAGKTLGVINLYLKEGHTEDEREKVFLNAIANVLAGVVRRRQSEEEREKLFHELQDTFGRISRSHREWQDTFDSITDLIYITDPEYKIIKANKAFAEHCGITPREAVNKKCYELFYKSDRPAEKCPHAISISELRLAQSEYVDRRTNRTFHLTAYPYFNDNGGLNGSIVVGKDVTEEKERDMRLMMSERLASLGQMVSSIAHEINNPLAAIAGCTEGLLKRVEQERFEPELFKSYLKIIEEEILRCKNITSGMLSFVRKTAYDKQAVDIHNTLDKTVEIIGFQGRLKEVDILKNYKQGLPHIQGSEGELRQVFLAIITNALDVMEDRGRLALETGIEGDKVYIKITDSGPGIPTEHITRVFEPFFTTKGEKGGTGLGLAIANKIITNHKGVIDVSSETGKGTTFRITLPL